MNSEKFFTWCRVAVKGIKYRPDRDKVHKELYEHLEDRYESFRSRGLEHDAAIDKTIEAMGSAEELAPQLAKIHRPFWSYMLIISRLLLIVSIIITLIPLGVYIWDNIAMDSSFDAFYVFNDYDAYADNEYSDEYCIAKRMLYLEPGCSASVDGYTVRATNAAWWRNEHFNINRWIEDTFYIRLEVTNLLPWEELANNIQDFFWAVDSLGNHYYGTAEHGNIYDSSQLSGRGQRSGVFSHTFELSLVNYISQDAEWIDLHYDRDGREFKLRIDLSGGKEI